MIGEALIITRREIRDALRDWRIVAPIAVLALVFPYVMQIASGLMISFGKEYGVMSVPFSFIPFALLIVGFFPMAISLVLALETFVGERERNSLEPLLASPLSDAALYLGKLGSAALLPLSASYLGMGSYLLSLFWATGYRPEPVLLVQILLLITVKAVVMVAAGVVISSHTTSVRSANLLAPIVIIPMGILVQVESLIIIWGYSTALWGLAATLGIVAVIFVRMGIETFNREEILAREAGGFKLRWAFNRFRSHLLGEGGFSLRRIYLVDLPRMLKSNRLALAVTLAVVCGALALGAIFELRYVMPGTLLAPHVQPGFESAVPTPAGNSLPGLDVLSIFSHNLRTLLIAAAISLFTFGGAALIVLSVPLALIGFFTAAFAQSGISPILFLGAFVLPHGIVEIPAAVLATAFALRLGAAMMTADSGRLPGDRFIEALADWVKVFVFLVVPMLLLAAILEAQLTPRLVSLLF